MQLHSIKVSRLERGLLLLLVYTTVLVASAVLAYEVRFEFAVPEAYHWQFTRIWPLVILGKLLCLWAFGQFESLLTFFSFPDLRRVAWASFLPFAILIGWWHWGGAPLNAPLEMTPSVPRGVIIIDAMLSFVGLAGVRMGFRMLRERQPTVDEPAAAQRLVAIMGAGEVGARLAQELVAKPRLGMCPVVFYDDDHGKKGTQVHGIPVVGPLPDEAELRARGVDEVIIAMPSAPARRMRAVVGRLQETGLKVETVPSMEQLAAGTVKVTQLRQVEIEDLLGRKRVELRTGEIRALLEGRRVMVTGAGGSIGAELGRQVRGYGPERLVLVDRSETQMFVIQQELANAGHAGKMRAAVTDLLDTAHLRQLLETERPEIVFHAAAHKHVPLMEAQPCEALRNNTLGTVALAELAVEHGVDRLVFVSTDKAINPTSVMGASKRLAEVYLQADDAARDEGTRFLAVRFGNVLGSSGSVVPIFRRQIAAGGPVTVTHPEVKRYFMLTSEAVGLVLQSAAMGEGGEIFVLDMGTPVKIADLAQQMIELSGFRPEEDIEIEYTGLRPGEKLFEEIALDHERHEPTGHDKIMRFQGAPRPLAEVREALNTLREHMDPEDPERTKQLIQKLIPEYTPWQEEESVARSKT